MAAEEYVGHMPCRGVTYRGAFKVLACPVELEPRSTLLIYFRFDRPVMQVPGLALRTGYGPPPAGVTMTLLRLYPEGEPESAGKENAVKVVVANESDQEAYVIAEAWLPR